MYFSFKMKTITKTIPCIINNTMTIKEVAKIAGVSPAAVSRYMNGGSLSAKKRESIRLAIEQTGYRPSQAARVMRTGEYNQIGMIIPKIYSDSVSQIVEGANQIIRDADYLLVVCSTDGDEEQELSYLELMENNQAAGIIIMGTSVSPLKEDAYKQCRVPLVITGQNVNGMPCIYHDDYHALKDLTGLIIERGRRTIAYIGVPETDPQAGLARRKGVEDALKELESNETVLYKAVADFDAQKGYECAKKLLEAHPDINGVICATDTIAMGAMRALTEQGRIISEDVSLAGVGDSWMNNFTQTPLTTAHFFFRQCGEAAATMLLDAISHSKSGDPFPPRQICLKYDIIERMSV